MDKLNEAILMASELHKNQVRKGNGVPYISHLLAVSAKVMEYGGNEDETIAALLHDTIEDCGGIDLAEEIQNKFGNNVLEIVIGCTDSFTQDKNQKLPWKQRKTEYMNHLPYATNSVRLVSCCDKIHNGECTVKDLYNKGQNYWNNFRGKKEGIIWYFQSLSNIFTEVGPFEPAKELRKIVGEMRMFE